MHHSQPVSAKVGQVLGAKWPENAEKIWPSNNVGKAMVNHRNMNILLIYEWFVIAVLTVLTSSWFVHDVSGMVISSYVGCPIFRL